MDRQLLSRATDSSDAPTPGYMYLDIAKNAAGNPAVCQEIAKYLTARLQKNNPNVKYKCLKVISKTCVSPYLKGQFKRCLAQDPASMAAIKESLQFRGPPDPVRGDQPYEKVRTAAKEALDAVYSDTPADPSPSYSTPMASSYGGPAGGMAVPGGGGPRRMDGIGNPMFADPRSEPPARNLANMTAVDVLNEAKETVIGMIKDPLAKNVQIQPRTAVGYGGPPQSYGPPGRSELMHQTGGAWTMASNRGPAAHNPPPNFQNDSAYYKSRDNGNSFAWAQNNHASASGVGGSWASAPAAGPPPVTSQPAYNATPSVSITPGPSVTSFISPGGGGTASSDGSYEKQLIMELCPPGGMTAVPPPDKLNQFARSVSNLSPDLVCPALLDCLEEGQPWIIRAKALCVIETCMKHGQKPGETSNAYTDFFHACSGEIAPLIQHNRVQIREPAKRVMALMGVAAPSGSAPPPPVSPPPVPAPPASIPNLLDFDDDYSDPAPAEPAAPAPLAGGVPTLFGGLNVAGGTAPPAVPIVAAPAAPPPPPSSGNLLGDFLNAQSSAPAAPAAYAPASSGDWFGDMMVKPVAAPAPPETVPVPAPASSANLVSSMFDDLSLKSGGTQTVTAPSPAIESSLSSTGSAFGFINQTSSATSSATAAKPNPTPPTVPMMAAPRDVFDPLKNVTPNSQKNVMQVSPEQMQAMMYQQMMMQQQQYMLAMQQQRMNPLQLMNMMRQQQQQQQPAQGRAVASGEDKKFSFVQDAMSMEKKK